VQRLADRSRAKAGQDLIALSEISRGQLLRVHDLDRDRVLVERLALALGPLSRLRGLLARPALEEEEGMLLRPCSGVHTFFMRFSIDVLFLDREGRIVALRDGLAPWRVTPVFGEALAVLELRGGRAARGGVELGDRLGFELLSV
jgi:uncharacterized membrane protein (UPF0127 family)